MKQSADPAMKVLAKKQKNMTPAQERRVRDEVSEFIAELLEKRAAQLTRFGDTAARGTGPQA